MNGSDRTVLVGMSGGVDSAAAALLLGAQGYRVVGVTLVLWPPGEAMPQGARDAAAVCAALQIPHRVLDLRERFRQEVIGPFAREYTAGRTPNPCVVCNRRVKFAALWEEAARTGAEHIATGHYARMTPKGLCRGEDPAKDQSYVLWSLPRERMGHLLLPLGDRTKEEIRRLTAGAGLSVAHKADSQDICFVPGGDYAAFLEETFPGQNPPGRFLNREGAVLGAHRGLWQYTVGQRKGLGRSFGKPMFVGEIRLDGDIILVEKEELFRDRLTVEGLNWLDRETLEGREEFAVKLRYAAPAVAAAVTPLGEGRALVELKEPVRAITPGQSAVFYRGEVLCGGGVIARTEKERDLF